MRLAGTTVDTHNKVEASNEHTTHPHVLGIRVPGRDDRERPPGPVVERPRLLQVSPHQVADGAESALERGGQAGRGGRKPEAELEFVPTLRQAVAGAAWIARDHGSVVEGGNGCDSGLSVSLRNIVFEYHAISALSPLL